jgi:hypothetical protein
MNVEHPALQDVTALILKFFQRQSKPNNHT